MPEVIDKTDSNRGKAVPAIIIVAVLFVVYVLSYAPVVRLLGGHRASYMGLSIVRSGEIAIYKPVDWLIDHTPLKKPLWKWAQVWGVRTDFDKSWMRRHMSYR